MVKSPPANAGQARDTGSNPVSERDPGEGNGNEFQYSRPCGQRRLMGYSPWGRKEPDTSEHSFTDLHSGSPGKPYSLFRALIFNTISLATPKVYRNPSTPFPCIQRYLT